MKIRSLGIALLTFSISLSSNALEKSRVFYRIEGGKRSVVSVTPSHASARPLGSKGTVLRQGPYYITHSEAAPGSPDYHDDLAVSFEERVFPSAQLPAEAQAFLLRTQQGPLAGEFRALRLQGPAANRINLTILGDGYTEAEKEKFFEDAERTTKGLFEGQTFASYLPLFNVYAVFVASKQSGIGDGQAKDTAFRLYRSPAGSKRAIMPGNESAMERALELAPATDYPIVLANDEYYGGLGGRWAISTSSKTSGLIVLRHELGHNFGEVGEEYDNGQVYAGANSSRSASNPSWSHWLQGASGAHEAKLLSGDYVWKNLSQGAYETTIKMPAQSSRLDLELSTVGWSTPGEVDVLIAGTRAEYDGVFHKDRSFFTIETGNRAPGENLKLRIEEKLRDGDNVLGFALAYAYPLTYDFTPGRIAAFASYSQSGAKSYRPTHDSCLMKDMKRENFCVVDQENMWLQFLNRVSLIDEVAVKSENQARLVQLQTPPLKGLSVQWYAKVGGSWTEQRALRDQWSWNANNSSGEYKVEVKFLSDEIRKASTRLTATKTFRL